MVKINKKERKAMTKKPNLLKGLLATASTVAVLMGGAESAMAVINTNAVVADTTGQGLVGGAVVVDNDEIQLQNNGDTFNVLTLVNGLILDNNTKVGILNVAVGGSGGSLGELKNGPLAKFNIADNTTYSLVDASNYQITATTIGAGSELIAGLAGQTVTGTIDGTGDDTANLTVAGGTFAGGIGGNHRLNNLTLNGATTFTTAETEAKNVIVNSATKTEFQAGLTAETVTFTKAGTLSSTTGGDLEASVFKFNDIDGVIEFNNNGQFLKGNVTTTGDGTVGTVKLMDGTATEQLGTATNRLKAVEAGEIDDATFEKAVYAKALTFKAATVNDFQDLVDVGIGGTATFEDDATVTLAKSSNLGVIEFAGHAGEITLADDVVLTGTTHSNAANAKLHFAGSGTFLGNLGGTGAGDSLAEVTFGANDETVLLSGDSLNSTTFKFTGTGSVILDAKTIAASNVATTITFKGNDGTLNLVDGITVTGAIDNDTTASKGKVVFAGSAKVTGIVGTAAANHDLNSITFAGKSGSVVAIEGASIVAKNSIAFDGDVTLTTKVATIIKTDAITVKIANTGTIIAGDDLTLTSKAIGTANAYLKEVRLTADKTVAVNYAGDADVYTSFTTATANKGTLTFSGGKHNIGNIGTAANPYKVVNAGAGGDETFIGNVYTQTFNNTAGGARTLNFKQGLTGDTFNSTANGTLVFADGATSNMLIKGANNPTVTFEGDTTISKDLGETGTLLAAVNFTGKGKTVNVGANIYTTAVTAGANTLNFTTNTTVSGTTLDATGTTLQLNNNTLTLGNTTFTRDNATVVSIAKDATTNGLIDHSASTKGAEDFSQNTLNITGAAGIASGTTFTVYKGGNAAPIEFGTITKESRYFGFTNKVNGKNIDVTAKQDLNIQDDIKNVAGVNAADITVAEALNARMSTATGNAAKEINFIAASKTSEEAAQRVQKITPNASTTTAAAQAVDVSSAAQRNISARTVDIQTVGAAAGDSASTLGAWVKGFYARAVEKSKGNASGYKSNIGGGTIGFDMQANDATVVGAAVTLADTNAKFKGSKAGNKLDGKSMLFNVYGIYDLANDMFVQADVNFGNTKVKNITKRNFGTATGKYDVMSYGLSALVGYNVKAVEGVVATPMAGLSYGKFLASGFTETGAGASNQIHTKKNFDKIVGTLGLRLIGQMNAGSDMDITPEAHAFINHDFRAKALKDEFTIDGLGGNIVVKGTKPAKTSYNLGLSLNAKSGNMEYGVGYDAELRNKYISHQGSVKVRVNF
jgi:outer membrane autotransporter protein